VKRRGSTTNRVVVFLIVFFAVGYAALTVYAFVDDTVAERILRPFRVNHAFTRGLYLFITYLIPIQASAMMLAYSLLFRASEAAGAPFHSLISGTMVLLIVLTAAYVVLENMALPAVERRVEDRLALSRSARDYLGRARKHEAAGELAAAAEDYGLYLEIDTENEELMKRREELTAQVMGLDREAGGEAAAGAPGAEAEAAAAAEGPRALGMEYDPEELVLKAAGYMAEEDYLNAHYFASLALRLDASSEQAVNLRNQAWEELNRYSAPKDDREAGELFFEKVKGLSALEEGDYMAAYYLFKGLVETHPEDTEAPEFLARSRAAMRTMAFFLDEAVGGLALPGTGDLLFCNPGEDGSQEVVRIDQMTGGGGEIYFYGIEAARFDPDGGVDRHLRAPYGKLIGDHINMNCRDRDTREEAYLPEYRVGGPGETGYIATLHLQDPREVRYLPALSTEQSRLHGLGIYDLWKLRSLYERAGYDPSDVEIGVLMRIIRPFLFLILSVLAMAMGWAYRSRYLGRPPVPTFIVLPVLPLVLVVVSDLFLRAHEILFRFFLISLGFTYAAAFLFLAESLFLIVSLFLLSGQMSEA